MGRQQFETVVAQAPKKRLLSTTQTGISLMNGTIHTFSLYAGPNKVGKVKNLKVSVPAPVGQANGYHSITVGHAPVGVSGMSKLYASQTAINSSNTLQYGHFLEVTGVNVKPSTVDAQVMQSQDLDFDDSKALTIYVSNQTGVNLNNIEIGVVYMEEEVR